MRQSGLLKVCVTFMILASCITLFACGEEEKGARVIIHHVELQRMPLYAEAGGLGGMTSQVNTGEFATLQEERIVGADVVGAIPGEWVKIRTLYDPREGWVEKRNVRLAPNP